MKIAMMSWKDPWHPKTGGAETFAWETAKRLVRLGHDVIFYASDFSDSDQHPSIEDGIQIVRLGNKFTCYRKIKSAVLDDSWDFVIDIVNTRPFMLPEWQWKLGKDTKSVALVYQTAEEVWNSEVVFPLSLLGRYILEPWWLSAYSEFPTWTISLSSKTSLEVFGLRNVKVLGIAANLPEKALHENTRKNSVTFCARLVEMKRPFDAIAAFEIMLERSPNLQEVSLEIIGSGPLQERIEKHATKSAFNINVHGRVSELEKNHILASSYAVIGTSVREGWGLTMSEGANLGAIPVAYDVPGLRDSTLAASGLIAEPNPEALSRELEKSIVNYELYKPSDEIGLQTWENLAEKITNFGKVQTEGYYVRPRSVAIISAALRRK